MGITWICTATNRQEERKGLALLCSWSITARSRVVRTVKGLSIVAFCLWPLAAPVEAGAVHGPRSAALPHGGGGKATIEFAGGKVAAVAAATHAGTYEGTIEVVDASGKRVAFATFGSRAKGVRVGVATWVPATTAKYTIKISLPPGAAGSYTTN
jgi:hypothetical protein